MTYGILISFVFAVLRNRDLCHGYSSAKYTWPLPSETPLLMIQNEVADGEKGCPLSTGTVHSSLLYSGIYASGSSNSHVDINVDDSNLFEDYSFAIYANADNTVGGTIFHYKQDESTVDPAVEKIKDVTLFYNSTHLVVETMGPNNEVYGSIATTHSSTSFWNTWTGFGVSYDSSGRKLKLLTSTTVDEEETTLNKAHIGQPGKIRIGGSFYPSQPSFRGDLICLNMYDTKIKKEDVGTSLQECERLNWDDITVPTEATCDGYRGYFEVKQKDTALQQSIASLGTMTTMSRVKCADLCLRTELCWTFTLDKVAGVCKLFDADYSANTESSVGTHYYMRRDICC